MRNFFIWCAGSDTRILSKCSNAERTKHMGYGTLVLIPAVLAFISMCYALSTIDKINDTPSIWFAGGAIWALIIFAMDRFIVSTHRRRTSNLEEFKNINLYLRLFFALFLGMVSSHPFVLLYFDGSITHEIKKEITENISEADSLFRKSSDSLSVNLNELVNHKQCLEKLLTAEQSGHKVALDCGYASGIPNVAGSFPRTKEIKRLIETDSVNIAKERERVSLKIAELNTIKEEKQDLFKNHTSFDYLKRELTLTKLKKGNSIIGATQWLLMIVLILLDISAVLFKTFAPFGLYDKVLRDEADLLKKIDVSGRQGDLQKVYDRISKDYMAGSETGNSPEAVDGRQSNHIKS